METGQQIEKKQEAKNNGDGKNGWPEFKPWQVDEKTKKREQELQDKDTKDANNLLEQAYWWNSQLSSKGREKWSRETNEAQQTMTLDQAINHINNVTDQELEKLVYDAERKIDYKDYYNKTTQAIQVLLNNFLNNPWQDRIFVKKSLKPDGKFGPKTNIALRAFEILCGNKLQSEHSNLNTVKLLVRLAKHKDIKNYYDTLLKDKESYTDDELEELVAYGNTFKNGFLFFHNIKNLNLSQAKILSKIGSPKKGRLHLGELENLNTETAKALSSRYVENLDIDSVEIKKDVAQVLWKGSIKNLWIKKPNGTNPLIEYWWKEVESYGTSIQLERVDNNKTSTTLNNQSNTKN